ncbi:hypothetical protein PHMEG_0006689 [Phytophthora megakarya]|uniref:Uncharacterized protein n=1 Tax=Phytophthora megakarya TaxID=4795 RepID=A0A225WN91_9STRA|nr:hypothetical protein PHMEG_0006689 [Phytophthora megakarya]
MAMAMIAVYNLFMNGVDRVDQRRHAYNHCICVIESYSTISNIIRRSLRHQQVRRDKKQQRVNLVDIVGADTSLYIITPNSAKPSSGKLNAFHYQDVFKARSPKLRKALDSVCRATADDLTKFTQKRANKSITRVED